MAAHYFILILSAVPPEGRARWQHPRVLCTRVSDVLAFAADCRCIGLKWCCWWGSCPCPVLSWVTVGIDCPKYFVRFRAERPKVLGSFLWDGAPPSLPFAHHLRSCYSLEAGYRCPEGGRWPLSCQFGELVIFFIPGYISVFGHPLAGQGAFEGGQFRVDVREGD